MYSLRRAACCCRSRSTSATVFASEKAVSLSSTLNFSSRALRSSTRSREDKEIKEAEEVKEVEDEADLPVCWVEALIVNLERRSSNEPEGGGPKAVVGSSWLPVVRARIRLARGLISPRRGLPVAVRGKSNSGHTIHVRIR